MTVEELIAELQKHDPKLLVAIAVDDGPIREIDHVAVETAQVEAVDGDLRTREHVRLG